MITKKYNLINNVTGWLVFVIALVTYWLTLEPTASYWDCGEFIIQADKLEVGHPPGNPIFMLTARFFANFAPNDAAVSVMVNAMSGLLSALTILLLFWTITHLVRRLVVPRDTTAELSLPQYLLIIGSGVVGALAYTWSDTFWFSAVEGEVYAFSSFCTALVFWLILKWENRADNPGSDRYLILIAYIIGVSIAVHLLNLLCIPAIVLVFAYRKWKDMNLVKSLIALVVSFVIVALVLFGLVPGFIKMAQRFELLFVNGFGMSFNSGALAYAFFFAALFIWAVVMMYKRKSALLIKLSVLSVIFFSGMFFMGSGWVLGWVLWVILAVWFFSPYWRFVNMRALNVIVWSIGVIFIGYSSYALILIRSSADTPMNQNSPDNVFDLASYLSREQYGETPLLYGETLYSTPLRKLVDSRNDTITYYEDGSPVILSVPEYTPVTEPGQPLYAKGVAGALPASENGFLNEGEKANNRKLAERGGDYYVLRDYKPEQKNASELNMFFPRIYSRMHRQYYPNWVTLDTMPYNLKEVTAIDARTGDRVPEMDIAAEPFVNPATGLVSFPQKVVYRPSYSQNLEYFLNYQLIHMYMRYFMWNFAGRQNDVLNQGGELDAGNWISGIPFIDNARLGDQSLLPDDLGKNNAGHNVFYMLPLILGIIGLVWQSFAGKKGIEQFWVIFFLFFMTGIAIVLYLNQPPMQPRERDYAFAGSFYAFAIWIGMGVPGLWTLINLVMGRLGKKEGDATSASKPQLASADVVPEGVEVSSDRNSLYAAAIAVILGLVIPVQMVSQTWDDHDRSRRTAARDFAINYLESLEPNAIVFCNGDNDTFPLWYAQEVEGIRPDVKIVNLSYLASDWYANQMRKQSYTAAPIDFTATSADIAYGNMDVVLLGRDRAPADLLESLKFLYAGGGRDNAYGYPMLPSGVVSIPVNKKAVVERGLIAPADTAELVNEIVIDLTNAPSVRGKGYVSLSELLMLDIIATNAAQGWPRPIYWCMTVGNEYHLGLSNYLRAVGMTHQLVPTYQEEQPARTDRGYDIVTKKYLWGGADNEKSPYFDETARRMLISTRTSMISVATELVYEGDLLTQQNRKEEAADKYRKAIEVLNLIDTRLPERTMPYGVATSLSIPELYARAGTAVGDKKAVARALSLLESTMKRMTQYLRYNRDVTMRFGQAPLTIESRALPYQFYGFIKLYEQYGGKTQKVDEILKESGFSRDELKKYYDAAYGSNSNDSMTDDDLVNELAGYARVVNALAGMTPDEYMQQPEDYRTVDSIFYTAYLQYTKYVGEDKLNANPDIKAVDMNRSRQLSEIYDKAHPMK